MIDLLLEMSGVSFVHCTQRLFSHIPLAKAQLEKECWHMLMEYRKLKRYAAIKQKAHSIKICTEQVTKSEGANVETTSLATQEKITTSVDTAARDAY